MPRPLKPSGRKLAWALNEVHDRYLWTWAESPDELVGGALRHKGVQVGDMLIVGYYRGLIRQGVPEACRWSGSES
jgi:hypothetical protein